MTQTVTDASGLVRVTVTAGDRRIDLALPTSVPVAELLPEIARSVGVLDPQTVHGGYALVTAEGRELSGEGSLTLQGVENGAVLAVTRGVDRRPPRVYDDIVEAMADVVESEMKPWEPASSRRTALGAAAVVLGIGALALALQRPDLVAGAAAGVTALVLAAAGVVLARVRGEHETALVLGWSAVVYAAVGGLTVAPEGPLLELPVTFAAVGTVLVGALAAFGLVERRTLLVPALAAGALLAAASGIVAVSGFRPAAVYTVALVVAVVAGSALPWLALGTTRTQVEQVHSHAEITADPQVIDESGVRADARSGHEVLLAVTATVGLVLLVVAPLAVSLGVTGSLVAVCAAAVLMLRTRQYRVGSEVAVGLVSGLVGLVATALAVLVLHPDWRGVVAVLTALASATVLLLTLVPTAPSVRRGRLGDITELVALVALLPLLVIAIGLVSGVRS
ncbi:MAG TPA: type VII secretion integral membrane protein EccD [Nocardioidaceae bacterium]|nr:type VII secretion integral membrane protein EccD [Nocardioidaceae bacterium]